MPAPSVPIEFVKNGDAKILLKSLAAGFGLNTETRQSIGEFFDMKMEEERDRADPRDEREAFNAKLRGDPQFANAVEPDHNRINRTAVKRAFGATAYAMSGGAAGMKASKNGLSPLGISSKKQLDSEIRNLETSIDGLQLDLDGEFLEPEGKKSTAKALRKRIINAIDTVSGAGGKHRTSIGNFVDDVILRGKSATGRVAGPDGIVLAAREFQNEMKMLLEQKKRALEGMEPAGVSGDPIGP